MEGAIGRAYGDFKGYKDKDKGFTFGQIQLSNGHEMKYFIETGNASMIMIHGIRTRIRTNDMTATQIDTIGRAWNKRLAK